MTRGKRAGAKGRKAEFPAVGPEIDLAFVDHTVARVGRSPDGHGGLLSALRYQFGGHVERPSGAGRTS